MTRARDRGFALLVVLWSAALLALIGGRITAAGRTEVQIAANLRANAVAEAAADGGVQEAIFRLLAAGGREAPLAFATTIGDAVVEVRAEPLRGRLNPNTAPAALTAALLRQLGVEPPSAASLGLAIEQWRTPATAAVLAARAAAYRAAGLPVAPTGRPFERLDELRQVVGMSDDLLALVRPHLSLFNFGPIDPLVASPALRRAMAETGAQQEAEDDQGALLAVEALARGAGGGSFARRAVVRLVPASGGRGWQVLAWESGLP
jgi:general secretion pathway protein K